MEFSVEPYRVTITNNGKRDIVHFESTMAACKALVSGVEASWTIAQWRKNEVTNELAYCGIGSFGGKIFAFRMGTEYAKSASRWMFETFKKSGMRKDLNNTTYISCEKFQMEMWEKKWGKMQEIANNKFPQFA